MANYVIVGGELYHSEELAHHGIKGQKWGVRRFQNKDGSLKPAGRKRYDTWADAKHQPSSTRSSALAGIYAATGNKRVGKALDKSNARDAERWKKAKQQKKEVEAQDADNTERKGLSDKQKKALKVGAAVAGTALATYGVYKVHQYVREANKEIRVGEELVRANNQIKVNFDNAAAVNRTGVLTNDQIQRANEYRNKWAKTMLDDAQNVGRINAKNDSFATAVKNVIDDRRKR